jgi:hypothetical protein
VDRGAGFSLDLLMALVADGGSGRRLVFVDLKIWKKLLFYFILKLLCKKERDLIMEENAENAYPLI